MEQIQDWLGYLEEKDDEGMNNTIRSNTKTRRPCGDEDFIKKIEGLIGRRLRTLPRGRPRKRQMVAVPPFYATYISESSVETIPEGQAGESVKANRRR